MDSVSQFVLGGALAAAALGPRTAAWRAVVWGGVVATIPDLDVLIDHGDPIRNMTMHRGHSHSLLWLTLAAPFLAAGIATLHRERAQFARWCVAVWLALVTHPLLDAMTIYGTQLLQPFTAHPFAVGSLFVIDPLYTLPLLVGCLVVAIRGHARGRRWNTAGLWLSTAYAAWSVVAQGMALAALREAVAARGLRPTTLLAMPAPLQTVLWRVLAFTETHAYEGFWSLCDDAAPLELVAIDRGAGLRPAFANDPAVARLVAWSGDTCKLERDGASVRITDLRFGQEPWYLFSFVVGNAADQGAAVPQIEPVAPRAAGARIPFAKALPWLWARMGGERLPTPR
ncbi:MAG: metal-dependent hydrolase [Planctomycetes bacterium]|nr:metal-dependent hydrolase [Planctomycetota bacterium]